MTLVKAGRLLDPRTGNVLSPAAVLTENGTIREVGAPSRVQADAPAGATIIDLGSATLLPGLIDSHTHLLLDVIVPPEAEIARRYNGEFVPGLLLAIVESPGKRVLLGAQLAREDLESGFTTVRNLGHSGIDGDAALRDAINGGGIPGPRILASGRKLAQQSKNGYDVIKVAIEDDITQAEMTAIVEEAHRQHLRVAVHAVTESSIQTAIDAGADSTEHGNAATDEQLRMMRDKGIFFDLTPIWADGLWTKIHETSVMSPALRSALAAADDRNRQRAAALIQRVLKSGVKFAAGSDMCWFYPGKTRGQATATMFPALRSAGMPPLDIIRAVTTNAADLLGWEDRVGAVAAGKFADRDEGWPGDQE